MENKCKLCPRQCGVNRVEGQIGFCGAGAEMKIARAALHHWEEPCISGTRGSGTIFFSHCTLKCVFCQNYTISSGGSGKIVTPEELAEHFLRLEQEGAHNINLVTPTHFVPQIKVAIDIVRRAGFKLPFVYNSSGYEEIETIKSLKGYVDIYMPDFKYWKNKYSERYSYALRYKENVVQVLKEMVDQVGMPMFDEEGIMKKGVIVRHLMLPHLLFDTKHILDYLFETYENKIYISLMNQYTPIKGIESYPELNQKLNPKHYETMIDYCLKLGITKAYIQEGDTADESFIPSFDLE